VTNAENWQRLYDLVRRPRPWKFPGVFAPNGEVIAWVHEAADVIEQLVQSPTVPSEVVTIWACRVAANVLGTGGLSTEASDEAIRGWLIVEVARMAAP
jgi:hypothetical protein